MFFFFFKIEVVTIKRMPRTMITLGIKKLLKEVAQYIPSKTRRKIQQIRKKFNKIINFSNFKLLLGKKGLCVHMYYDLKNMY